jgi:4,5-dihydroxyphthalate decarboxylase
MGWITISLPWIGLKIEETRELMGENFWPYGIEPNRKTLEPLFQYSYEQSLCGREITIEELFEPGSLKFTES